MKVTGRHPELVLDDAAARSQLTRRTRRSLLLGGAAALAGTAGYEWLTRAGEEAGLAWPQRRVLDANASLWHAYLSDSRLTKTFGASQVQSLKQNGDIGLSGAPDDQPLHVKTPWSPPMTFSMADVKRLPRVEMITRFCCIEGWNRIVHWGGARFVDFTRSIMPPGHELPPYVSMTTPDEEYYVGLDLKSALHAQTLLAYEYNGAPLTPEHGAPLRLVIPVKYGVKNIKRIGTIEYTGKRPADYWAEEGYDWFAGL